MPSRRARSRKAVDRVAIGRPRVGHPPAIVPEAVLGADAGIVEARGDRVGRQHLAVGVLQQIAVASRAARRACPRRAKRHAPRGEPPASTPKSSDARVVEERGEDPHRVRAAADAGDDHVRAAAPPRPGSARAPPARSPPGDRARSSGRDADRPSSRGCSAYRARSSPSRGSPRWSRPSACGCPIRPGAPPRRAVACAAHSVAGARDRPRPCRSCRHPEARRHRRGRHPVLPGAGLGDDAPLPHAPRQQRLTEAVVDLVRAGVGQVLALQIDPRPAAEGGAQVRREVERRRPPGVRRRAASRARAGIPDRAARRRTPPPAPADSGISVSGTYCPP